MSDLYAVSSSDKAVQSLPWDCQDAFVYQLEVDNQHIDVMGHTNNCEYLKWCEVMAWRHSEHLGLGIAEYREAGHGMAAVHTELDYLAATFAGEQLYIGTWIASCNRIGLVRHYQVIRPADGAVVLRANTRFVCVDLSSGRLRRLPESFKTAYGSAVVAAD